MHKERQEFKVKDYFGYEGKICVVTGASSGMGKAAANMLVDLGAKVYAIARRKCEVDGLICSIQADLSKKEEIDAAFGQIPDHIDSFFGVAGLSGSKSDYMTTFNVNYTANRYIAENYLKTRMQVGGSILFVTSTSGVAWRENFREAEKILSMGDWQEVQEEMAKVVQPGPPAQVA